MSERAKRCTRCAQIALPGKRLCALHSKSCVYVSSTQKRVYKRSSSKKKRAFVHPLKNDRRWRRIAQAFLSSYPLCVRCSQLGHKVAAVHVDHIKPVRLFADLIYEESNLQSLCRRCHSIKTVQEQNGTFHDYRRRKAYQVNSSS